MENSKPTTHYMVALDCETGGLTPESSLLTAYFAFLKYENGKFTQLDELDLKIKPDNDVYCVTAESLEINQIDLKEHNKVAIYQRKAGTLLYDKLRAWYEISRDKLIPIGHNVASDIRKITTTLLTKGSWENYVSYRVMDTCTIAQFLRIKGVFPDKFSCSLSNLGNHFLIQVPGKSHEAKYDTLVTVKVLEKMLG